MKTVFIILCLCGYTLMGQMVASKTDHDLGSLSNFDTESFEIKIKNNGSQTIYILEEQITSNLDIRYSSDTFFPGSEITATISLFPLRTGKLSEQVEIKFTNQEKVKIKVQAHVQSMSARYAETLKSNKLLSDKDITFMIVDSRTNLNVPYAKVYITNTQNGKSYIGYADQYGVLKNRIPEGSYNITCLTDGYKHQVANTKVDVDRNLAAILLEKIHVPAPVIKAPAPVVKVPAPTPLSTPNDTVQKQPIEETAAIVQKIEEPVAKEIIEELKSPEPITLETAIIESPLEEISQPIDANRKPLNIILLIDNSSSMGQGQKLNSIKTNILSLIDHYKPADQLAIITFNESVETVFASNRIYDKALLLSKIDGIETKGNTNGEAAINMAFEIMNQAARAECLNMIVLVTDGKIAKTSREESRILSNIQAMNEKGYLLSVMGYTGQEILSRKMQQMSDIGGGLYLNMNNQKDGGNTILLDEIYKTLLKLGE